MYCSASATDWMKSSCRMATGPREAGSGEACSQEAVLLEAIWLAVTTRLAQGWRGSADILLTFAVVAINAWNVLNVGLRAALPDV